MKNEIEIESAWYDIYIPYNVNEIWTNGTDNLQVIVNSESKLAAYVVDMNADGSYTHISGGLFKLIP